MMYAAKTLTLPRQAPRGTILDELRRGSLARIDERPISIDRAPSRKGLIMNNIVWIIGAVVIVIAILSFLGLR